MKLIPEWREAWRMNSMQIYAVIAAIPLIWMELPQEVKDIIPPTWQPYILAGIAVAGMIGRLRDQTK